MGAGARDKHLGSSARKGYISQGSKVWRPQECGSRERHVARLGPGTHRDCKVATRRKRRMQQRKLRRQKWGRRETRDAMSRNTSHESVPSVSNAVAMAKMRTESYSREISIKAWPECGQERGRGKCAEKTRTLATVSCQISKVIAWNCVSGFSSALSCLVFSLASSHFSIELLSSVFDAAVRASFWAV